MEHGQASVTHSGIQMMPLSFAGSITSQQVTPGLMLTCTHVVTAGSSNLFYHKIILIVCFPNITDQPVAYIGSYPYGQGNQTLSVGNFQCNGSEATWDACMYSTNVSCGHHEEAAVDCNYTCTYSLALANCDHDQGLSSLSLVPNSANSTI